MTFKLFLSVEEFGTLNQEKDLIKCKENVDSKDEVKKSVFQVQRHVPLETILKFKEKILKFNS